MLGVFVVVFFYKNVEYSSVIEIYVRATIKCIRVYVTDILFPI